MKKVFFGIALSIMSVVAIADSYLEDSADLSNCNGTVELRSYDENGESKYALKFIGVSKCSNVRLSSGKSYKLTDRDGDFQTKSFTLSDASVQEARRGRLGVLVESNNGNTSDEVSVSIRDRRPTPRPDYDQPEYEPAEWN